MCPIICSKSPVPVGGADEPQPPEELQRSKVQYETVIMIQTQCSLLYLCPDTRWCLSSLQLPVHQDTAAGNILVQWRLSNTCCSAYRTLNTRSANHTCPVKSKPLHS